MSTSLDSKIIKNVSDRVYQRFPEVSGTKPSIKKQNERKKPNRSDSSVKDVNSYLLTYKGSVLLGNGKKMNRWVRVVVDNKGKILKITTSR